MLKHSQTPPSSPSLFAQDPLRTARGQALMQEILQKAEKQVDMIFNELIPPKLQAEKQYPDDIQWIFAEINGYHIRDLLQPNTVHWEMLLDKIFHYLGEDLFFRYYDENDLISPDDAKILPPILARVIPTTPTPHKT